MSDLREYFYALFDCLVASLYSNETLLGNFLAEQSDFVRLNCNKIRQAGEVRQFELALQLIRGQRSVTVTCNLSGTMDRDSADCLEWIEYLREQIDSAPEDPYLSIHREIQHSESVDSSRLPRATDAIEEIISNSNGMDLVGFYASGPIQRGFANSLGQKNWHQKSSFHFEWSCFLDTGRAVKSCYAGFVWNVSDFQRKTAQVRNSLELLARPEKAIAPGHYRVFLAPDAVQELLSIVAWQGFGAKGHQTGQSSLFKLARSIESLDESVCLSENNQMGLAPLFTRQGFIKPDRVDLIQRGKLDAMLVDSRSAKEYRLKVNADYETPSSLDMAPGSLAASDVLASLDRGILISNLWYCNYSDTNDCRITGMTRYACFWVEHGKIVAPIAPMRFDESLYRLLGNKLLAITHEREWILSNDTYSRRSLSSMRIPGLLIDDFNFTL